MNVASHQEFIQLDIRSPAGIFSHIPASIGVRAETPVGGVIEVRRPPGALMFSSNGEFASVMLAPSPGMQAAFSRERLQTFDAAVGSIFVHPTNQNRTMCWFTEKQNIAIAFSDTIYENLASAELNGQDWQLLPPRFGHVDKRALRIAQAMSGELSRSTINMLCIESLITIMGVHLIRTYSAARNRDASPAKQALSGVRSRQLIAYMQDNLAHNISIADLAKVARMSPSHFLRVFTITFGLPPHQYLIDLRLSRAEKLLVETTASISEIAYRTGFASQSHLTTLMKRHKGITPGKLRCRD